MVDVRARECGRFSLLEDVRDGEEGAVREVGAMVIGDVGVRDDDGERGGESVGVREENAEERGEPCCGEAAPSLLISPEASSCCFNRATSSSHSYVALRNRWHSPSVSASICSVNRCVSSIVSTWARRRLSCSSRSANDALSAWISLEEAAS